MATRLFFGMALMLAAVQGARVELTSPSNIERVSHENTSFMELVSLKEHLDTQRATPYLYVKAASSPASTFCSWLWKDDRQFYKNVGNVCGVRGTEQGGLNNHVTKVWNLIKTAYSELGGNAGYKNAGDTLRIFLLPEWALARRYPADGTDFAAPLDFQEMQASIFGLEKMMKTSGLDFSDWLIVPGSIYWGFKVSHLMFGNAHYDYAVFNTAPVYYGGKFVWAHNKHLQADNLHTSEAWGYELVQMFQARPGCTGYDAGGARICGTVEFAKAVTDANGPGSGEALEKWGLMQPAYTILVNGLAVGLDICADHRNKDGIQRLEKLGWASKFDIQLLISSGMSFSIPEEDGQLALMLRQGGIALSSDGTLGPNEATRLFVAMATDTYSDQQGRTWRINLSLLKHFQMVSPMLYNSWTQGCAQAWMDNYNKEFCQYCTNPSLMNTLSTTYGSTGPMLGQYCGTEPGNWNILKVWNTPIQLPPTDNGHYKNSQGRALAFDALGGHSAPLRTGANTGANTGGQLHHTGHSSPASQGHNSQSCGNCHHGCKSQKCYSKDDGFVMDQAKCQGLQGIWCPY